MWLEASNHSCHIWQLCDRPLYSRSFYNVLKFKPTRVLNYTLFSPSFAFLFVHITVYLPLVSILPTEVKLNYIYMSCLPGGPGTWFSERTLKKKNLMVQRDCSYIGQRPREIEIIQSTLKILSMYTSNLKLGYHV